MDAGIVEFKLCNKAFECETCEFDSVVRQQPDLSERSTGITSSPSSLKEPSSLEAVPPEQAFMDALRKRLMPLWKQPLPSDRQYHRSHYWLRRETDDTFQFGIDHIAANLIHPVLSIVVPVTPFAIQRHDAFCWLILPGGALSLRSPIDGVIMQYNDGPRRDPSLLNREPYHGGQLMNIRLEGKKRGLSNFKRVEETQKEIEQQMADVEHSFLQAFRHCKSSVGTTLFDGGVRLENIESILGPQLFVDAVSRTMNLAL